MPPSLPLRPSLRPLLLLALASLSGACRAPELERAPWAALSRGGVLLNSQQPLFESFDVRGEFAADTPLAGQVTGSDVKPVEGRFGHALEIEWMAADAFAVLAGVEYREYQIGDLAPDGLPPVLIEPVDDLRFHVGFRSYLPPPTPTSRWRPYVGVQAARVGKSDLLTEIDLSSFGLPTNPTIDTEGQSYWVASGVLGVIYQWSDHLFLRGGALYEVPLEPMYADLSLDLAGSVLPFVGEFHPEGPIVFAGLSWSPL